MRNRVEYVVLLQGSHRSLRPGRVLAEKLGETTGPVRQRLFVELSLESVEEGVSSGQETGSALLRDPPIGDREEGRTSLWGQLEPEDRVLSERHLSHRSHLPLVLENMRWVPAEDFSLRAVSRGTGDHLDDAAGSSVDPGLGAHQPFLQALGRGDRIPDELRRVMEGPLENQGSGVAFEDQLPSAGAVIVSHGCPQAFCS